MKKTVIAAWLIILCGISEGQIFKKSIPDKLIVLTFDDATASHYSIVAPMLKKFGFGATFFICEFPPNFKDSSIYMNWRQIKALDRMGFEIANHTQNHPAISKLTAAEFNRQLEYIEKKCDSMKIAHPISFAYPGYDLNFSSVEQLKKKGYQFARVGGSRPYDPKADHPLLIPSWAMNGGNMDQMKEALWQSREGKIVVFTIHGVPDLEHSWVTTPPELFRSFLEFLYDNNFKVISLRDLSKYVRVKRALRIIEPDLTKKLRN